MFSFLGEIIALGMNRVGGYARQLGAPRLLILFLKAGYVLFVALPGFLAWVFFLTTSLRISTQEFAAWPGIVWLVVWLAMCGAVNIFLALQTIQLCRKANRKKYVVAGIIGCFLSCGGYGTWVVHRSSSAQQAFVKLLHELDTEPNAFVNPANGGENPHPPLLVVLRDSWNGIPGTHRVKTGLSWSIPLAADLGGVRTLLLVNRTTLAIRTYRPSGADYQVVFSCRLVNWERRQAVEEFTVMGTQPKDRSGAPAGVGGNSDYGSEPWEEVRKRVEQRLGWSK